MSCSLHTERHIRHSVQLALPREASSVKASTLSNFATFHAQVHSDDNNTRSTKPLECGHLHCLETRQDNHITLSIATASNLPPRCLHDRCVVLEELVLHFSWSCAGSQQARTRSHGAQLWCITVPWWREVHGTVINLPSLHRMNRWWWGCGSRSDEAIMATTSFALALQADVEVVQLYTAQCCPSAKKKRERKESGKTSTSSHPLRHSWWRQAWSGRGMISSTPALTKKAAAAAGWSSSMHSFTIVWTGGNVARRLQGFFHRDHLATATRSKRTQCCFTHKNLVIMCRLTKVLLIAAAAFLHCSARVARK